MAKKVTVKVTDPVGLYASPATELVDAMKVFNSDITITYQSKSINLKSLMGVLSLGIPSKAIIEIEAEGDDEEAVIQKAVDVIKKLGISDAL